MNNKIYLLWFNEWEPNYVLGIFETKEKAEQWKEYFLNHPLEDGKYSGMTYYAQQGREEYGERFEIEECEVGKLDSEIKIDNLAYLEMKYDQRRK